MKTALTLSCALALTACASHQADPNYTAYIAAINAQQAAHAAEPRRILVDIGCAKDATSCQPIKVYEPSGNAPTGPAIAMPQPQANEWAGVATTALGVIGNLGGYAFGAKAAVGIANSIRDAGTAGYKYVQAPAAPVIPQANNTTITTASVGGSGAANTGSGNAAANPASTVTTTDTTSTLTKTGSDNPVSTTTTNPVVVR
jgi:hypothetical protein